MATIVNEIDKILQAAGVRVYDMDLPDNIVIDYEDDITGDKPPLNANTSAYNFFHSRYVIFNEPFLPPTSVVNGPTVALEFGNGVFSGQSIEILANATADPQVFLGNNSTDYNFLINPNGKWVISGYVYCSAASKSGALYIRASDGTYYNAGFTTGGAANTWERFDGVLDLTSNASTSAICRLDNDGGNGVTMWFDGLMLEEQNGTVTEPSVFSLPPISEDSIDYSHILDDAITTAKIFDDAITAAKVDLAAINALGGLESNTVDTAQLVNNAVENLQLLDGAVTAAKTNVAAISSITGNLNNNTVDTNQIVSNAVRSLELNAGAVTAAKTALSAISSSTGNLTSNSVTANNIVAGTITASEIQTGTITSNQIASNTIVAGDILSGTITSTQIQAGTIVASDIATGTITADELASNSVTAVKIQANAVTSTKISVGNLSAIHANLGTVTAGAITGTAGMDITGEAKFDGAFTSGFGESSVRINYDKNADFGLVVIPGSLAGIYIPKGTITTNEGINVSMKYSAEAIVAASETGDGGYFTTGGSASHAVLAKNTHSTGHAFRGRNDNASTTTSGLVGAGNAYNFYADGNGTDYGPFTGSHEAISDLLIDLEIGDIVRDKELIVRAGISNTLFEIELTDSVNDPSAVGVVAVIRGKMADEYRPASAVIGRENVMTETEPHSGRSHDLNPNGKVENWKMVETQSPDYELKKETHRILNMNSLGEGQVSVCNEGGDITAGDLITTSSKTGKGMKQADGIIRNYTVAKARESVTFQNQNHIRLIACIYLCG